MNSATTLTISNPCKHFQAQALHAIDELFMFHIMDKALNNKVFVFLHSCADKLSTSNKMGLVDIELLR